MTSPHEDRSWIRPTSGRLTRISEEADAEPRSGRRKWGPLRVNTPGGTGVSDEDIKKHIDGLPNVKKEQETSDDSEANGKYQSGAGSRYSLSTPEPASTLEVGNFQQNQHRIFSRILSPQTPWKFSRNFFHWKKCFRDQGKYQAQFSQETF